METKLKLVLRSPVFQLAFKAAIFGLTLYFSVPFAIVVALWLYFRPLFNAFSFFFTLAILLFLSLWMLPVFSNILLNWFVIILLSSLFFVILGLKNLVFVQRRKWYLFLNFSLFYLTFINFFLINKSSFFLGKWLIFLAVMFLLLRELLRSTFPELADKANVVGLVLALVMGELFLVIGWLPLGFISSANLMTLFLFLIIDLIFHHFWRTLNRKIIVKDLLFFCALLFLIFITSQWSL